MTRGRLAAVVAVAALLLFWAPACSSDPVRRISLSGRPSAVAVLDDLIWITDDAASVVRTIDAETAEQTGDPVRVARNPVAVAAGSDALWVGHAGGEVSRIDARSREVKTVEAGGSITGIATRGSRVWAADLATKSLVELDAGSLELRRIYRLNDGVVRVALSGSILWVTNSERTVTRVDPLSHDVGPAVPTGLGPIGLVWTG
ncbi:MAG: hypothetical protein ACRDKJ_00775, partial [Actinomycetota bacterium]